MGLLEYHRTQACDDGSVRTRGPAVSVGPTCRMHSLRPPLSAPLSLTRATFHFCRCAYIWYLHSPALHVSGGRQLGPSAEEMMPWLEK